MSKCEQKQAASTIKTGVFQGFELTHNQFGQQYSTIDDTRLITWFNLIKPKLKGLQVGSKIEFSVTPAPTVLCHSPHVEEPLPSADILRVLPNEGGAA